MSTDHRLKLTQIKRFDQLIAYLRDEMGWPIARDSFDDVEDLFYEFSAEELGIDPKTSAKILEIKRLRPLSPKQPWGIFFVKFEPKKLPVIALRRILGQVALKRRASANSPDRTAWSADDLLFISNYGDGDARQISFAHFSKSESSLDLPTLRVLGWNNLDTGLHLDAVANELTENLTWPEEGGDLNQWRKSWSNAFKLGHNEVINTAKDLSLRLAELACSIRDRIKVALSIENDSGPLKILMRAFKSSLVNDLDNDAFADMYAQTIAYGLLSARISDPTKKSVDDFTSHMRTSPFLRELMENFLRIGGRKGKAGGAGIDFDELGVGDVIQLLDNVNIEAVLRDFGDKNRQEDPVMHFFEGFLQAYDKKIRKDRGVFYTPQPVVSYIVRSVHELLQNELGLTDGLADITTWGEMLKKHPEMKLPPLTDEPGEKRTISPDEPFVQILDPATGTATFLIEIIEVVHQTLTNKWKLKRLTDTQQLDAWNEYVPKNLLPRLHAFELMMAPYAIAHMKVGLKLAETGYRFISDERARIYLTNALEPWQKQLNLPELDALAHEAVAVNNIKRNKRFTVVIGNPPYSGESSNKIQSVEYDLKNTYQSIDGVQLIEKGKKNWLLDDYVKFLRLAHKKIKATGCGYVGYITNNAFQDNPTFRGLRRSLLGDFSTLQILDLHGSGKRADSNSKAEGDENVFDILQGVCVLILSRVHKQNIIGSLTRGDLWGSRKEKYKLLSEITPSSLILNHIHPKSDQWYFIKQDLTHEDEWLNFFGLLDAMPINGNGLISAKDHFAYKFTAAEFEKDLKVFLDESLTDKLVAEQLSIRDNSMWSLHEGRIRLRKELSKAKFCQVTYRPFDMRHSLFHRDIIFNLRLPVTKNIINGDNIVLLVTRMTKGVDWRHCFVSRTVSDCALLSNQTSTNSFAFPLKLKRLNQGLFPNDTVFDSNFSPEFLEKFRKILGGLIENKAVDKHFTQENIFNYMYAIFHSSSYRSRYSEFLKTDFPRLPLTNNLDLFSELAYFGEELIKLHLLESIKLALLDNKFIGSSHFEIEKISWSRNTVWVDKSQTTGFPGVNEDVWNFHIGSYQICEKWLKDRKGRKLSNEDIFHYQKIVIALTETVFIMKKIDETIAHYHGWPGSFGSNKFHLT
jgi:predicted helicase